MVVLRAELRKVRIKNSDLSLSAVKNMYEDAEASVDETRLVAILIAAASNDHLSLINNR